jgi:hypothetical protein
MLVKEVMEKLRQVPIYVIVEKRIWRSDVIDIYFSREESFQRLNELSNRHCEIIETTINEYLTKYERRSQEKYLSENKEKLYAELNETVKYQAEKQAKQEYLNVIDGMLYYLSENGLVSNSNYETKRKCYLENATNCRE